ncbi:MAG: hypothetical protein K6L81_06205 [Agarilytica sp.]
MKYLFGFFILVASLDVFSESQGYKAVENVATSIALDYIENLKEDDVEYKNLIRDLLSEKKFEVFAALELNRIGQQYISERYIFGSPVILSGVSSSPFAKEMGVDKASLERELAVAAENIKDESPFERIDIKKLKQLSVLVGHLDKVISAEIDRR